MAKSVQELPGAIREYIDISEWDMRTLEGNSRYIELRARQLPSIALDGELVFESLIPGQEELIAAITERWKAKNRAGTP